MSESVLSVGHHSFWSTGLSLDSPEKWKENVQLILECSFKACNQTLGSIVSSDGSRFVGLPNFRYMARNANATICTSSRASFSSDEPTSVSIDSPEYLEREHSTDGEVGSMGPAEPVLVLIKVAVPSRYFDSSLVHFPADF